MHPHLMINVRRLGRLALQELPPRRDIEKQLAHLHHGPRRAPRLPHVLQLPSIDHDLQVMRPDQSPDLVCSRVLAALSPILTDLTPDLVLVQGDTTTTLCASMAAFYLKGRDRDHIVMGGMGVDYDSTAVHEFVHLLVARSGTKLPLWLNEGLAELYSNLEPQGKTVHVGKLIPGQVLRLRETKWIPLDKLTEADRRLRDGK